MRGAVSSLANRAVFPKDPRTRRYEDRVPRSGSGQRSAVAAMCSVYIRPEAEIKEKDTSVKIRCLVLYVPYIMYVLISGPTSMCVAVSIAMLAQASDDII